MKYSKSGGTGGQKKQLGANVSDKPAYQTKQRTPAQANKEAGAASKSAQRKARM